MQKTPYIWNYDELAFELSISTSTAKRWVRKGLLPKPEYYGPQIRRWKIEVIDGWKNERAKQSNNHVTLLDPRGELKTQEAIYHDKGMIIDSKNFKKWFDKRNREALSTVSSLFKRIKNEETLTVSEMAMLIGCSKETIEEVVELGFLNSEGKLEDQLSQLFFSFPALNPFVKNGNKTAQAALMKNYPALATQLAVTSATS